MRARLLHHVVFTIKRIWVAKVSLRHQPGVIWRPGHTGSRVSSFRTFLFAFLFWKLSVLKNFDKKNHIIAIRKRNQWRRQLIALYIAIQKKSSFLVPFFSSILSGSFPYPEIFDFITDGILVIFSYLSQPEKQRPIIIKEFFLKICWKILLQNMPDDPLLLSLCSSFGRKDGCPSVVHAVQTALNNGVEVLSSDFENCFNLIDRNFVFEYLRKNESIYSSLFPLLNICYARKTNCFNFKNFLPNFHINILTGTCQGCVSGPFFLELAKAPTLSILQQEISLSSVSVADDIYFLNPFSKLEEPHKVEFFQNTLRKAGFHLNYKKCKVICPRLIPNSSKPGENFHLWLNIEITYSPTSALGVCLFPSLSPPYTLLPQLFSINNLSTIKNLVFKLNKKMQFILTMPASLQIKFLTLLSLQFNYVYHMQAMPETPFSNSLFEHIENSFFTCLCKILRVREDPSLHVRFFSPFEDGGMGLLPVTVLRKDLLNMSVAAAIDFCSKLSLPLPNYDPFQSFSLKHIWRNFSKLHRPPNVFNAEHSSWLSAWPKDSTSRLLDEEFLFACHLRLGRISPPIQKCKQTLHPIKEEECFAHVFSCLHCGGIFNHLRHEFINNSLCSTFKKFNIPCSPNPDEFPLPFKEKGGPDFIIYVGSRIIAGDVTITKNSPSSSYVNKMRLYKNFSLATGFEILPVSISILGQIEKRSFIALREIARQIGRSELMEEVVNVIQFGLIRGMFAALRTSHARAAAGELFSSPFYTLPPTVEPSKANEKETTKSIEPSQCTDTPLPTQVSSQSGNGINEDAN